MESLPDKSIAHRKPRRRLVTFSRTRLIRLKNDGVAFALVERVARSRRVGLRAIVYGKRGSGETALARQVAMYLLHVLLGRTQEDVGRLFGRERTTVWYACAIIEALRDEDDLLRAEIERIEAEGWGRMGGARHAA